MICLVRCDDRLIHGQCMTVIVKAYDIQEIIVVDEFTATNAILKTVFKTAVPPSMKADIEMCSRFPTRFRRFRRLWAMR